MTPRPVRTFVAIPSLPPKLERLRELAYNVRWAWHEDTLNLFRRLDADLWSSSGHNPVQLLSMIAQEKLAHAARDEGFLAHLADVCADYDAYMSHQSTWFKRHHEFDGLLTAYFSAEFGVTECMSIFAGGLGVLAGDHLKSASNLGIPIAGVGLMYQQGYFRQHLDAAGWQRETYKENDCASLPLELERNAEGHPLVVSVGYSGHQVFARIWRLQVGRVPLFLLDTNFALNTREEDRDLTDYLYGGGNELRIRQEIMLGIGGYRALRLLNLQPQVYHINEGHSAFLALEHIRRHMKDHGLTFEEARIAATSSIVFTTHTPVKAGHDRFSPELMDRYLIQYAKNELGLPRRDFLALGREDATSPQELFGMTKLALRMSAANNGVARLHGEVSRKMWHRLWPMLPEDEVPIGHITNGVHVPSWVSSDMKQLLDRYLGPRWREESGGAAIWRRAEEIPDQVLWQVHVGRRERLISKARNELRRQLERSGAPRAEIDRVSEVLDPNALTIGFARRFATYKRATLVLRDSDRLARILMDEERPVQIVFAGKAHPRDHPGKELIQRIVSLSRTEPFRRRIVFLEDYDMSIARYLVQGVDLWLNTPRRPREASGTSGMKAAANGGLNLSILDGWWDEGYDPEVGWAIGNGETYNDHAYQDEVDANHLYDRLELDVVPMFYDRSPKGLPLDWIHRMKQSIARCNAVFNSHRMVQQYTESAYLPAAEHSARLLSNELVRTRAVSAWQKKVESAWPGIRVEISPDAPNGECHLDEHLDVQARVHLGGLTPDDVEVQLYLGRVTSGGAIVEPQIIPMHTNGSAQEDIYTYRVAEVTCGRSGFMGYTVRVLPNNPDSVIQRIAALMVWAGETH